MANEQNRQAQVDLLPPQDLFAEQALLGSILLDPECLAEFVGFLRPDHFYGSANRAIYEAALRLFNSGTATDAVTLKSEVERSPEETERRAFEEAGGVEYLAELMCCVPSAANAENYAKIVREKATRRAIIRACHRSTQAAHDPSQPIEGVIGKVETELLKATEIIDSRTVSVSDATHEVLSIIDKAERGIPLTGMPTGFRDLDMLLGGLRAGELVILAGRPGSGKTTLALNTASNAACQKRFPTLFVSEEMPATQLAMNFLAARASLSAFKMRTGKLSSHEHEKLCKATGDLLEVPLRLCDSAGLPVLALRSLMRKERLVHKTELVIVDYLQLLRPSQNFQNRQEQVADISRHLKAAAKELGIAVLALSQLNRSCEARDDKRPRLSDLRESGAIEQDADAVLLLHREELYSKKKEVKGKAEVIVAKQRNGPTGTVKLRFNAPCLKFTDETDANGNADTTVAS